MDKEKRELIYGKISKFVTRFMIVPGLIINAAMIMWIVASAIRLYVPVMGDVSDGYRGTVSGNKAVTYENHTCMEMRLARASAEFVTDIDYISLYEEGLQEGVICDLSDRIVIPRQFISATEDGHCYGLALMSKLVYQEELILDYEDVVFELNPCPGIHVEEAFEGFSLSDEASEYIEKKVTTTDEYVPCWYNGAVFEEMEDPTMIEVMRLATYLHNTQMDSFSPSKGAGDVPLLNLGSKVAAGYVLASLQDGRPLLTRVCIAGDDDWNHAGLITGIEFQEEQIIYYFKESNSSAVTTFTWDMDGEITHQYECFERPQVMPLLPVRIGDTVHVYD